MVADPTVGKYMVVYYHKTVHYSNMYFVVLWAVCGCLVELWLGSGHVYVTRIVYKHSDITYSTILMPSLSEKSLFDTATLYSYLWFTGWFLGNQN